MKNERGIAEYAIVMTLALMGFAASQFEVEDGIANRKSDIEMQADIASVFEVSGLGALSSKLPTDSISYDALYSTVKIYDDGGNDPFDEEGIFSDGTLTKAEIINEYNTIEDWMENIVFFDDCWPLSYYEDLYDGVCEGPYTKGDLNGLVSVLHAYIATKIDTASDIQALRKTKRPWKFVKGKNRKLRAKRAVRKVRRLS
jgi:hypothetical protein